MSARQTSDGAVRAKTRVCVFGSGSFGTALGTLVARNGYTVTLLTRREEVAVSVNTKHVNPQHLSECRLPPNLSATTSAEEALRGASFIVHSVPVQSTESFLAPLRDLVPPGVPFISTSKGLHSETLETMNELVPRVLGRPQPMAFLSGPTFAKELVDSQPSGAVMASEDLRVAEACAAIFHCQSLRCYTTDDVIGVEVGGALKNVYALAAGTIEGMGLGVNPMAFMVTRACSEMSCLAVAMGARAHTMAGLAGIGDLMLTCMGGASRNKAVGIKIGQGETLDTVLQNRSQSLAGVAEGVATAPAAVKLARKLGVDTPVADAVAAVISQSMGAREAMMSMMQKPPRGDFSADGHRAETAMESKKGSLLGLPPVAWAALAAAEAAALACLAVWAARRQK